MVMTLITRFFRLPESARIFALLDMGEVSSHTTFAMASAIGRSSVAGEEHFRARGRRNRSASAPCDKAAAIRKCLSSSQNEAGRIGVAFLPAALRGPRTHLLRFNSDGQGIAIRRLKTNQDGDEAGDRLPHKPLRGLSALQPC
jgi:hypothetical protein